MPTIVLGQDEVDCFAAWVSAESGLPEHVEPGSDIKVYTNAVILKDQNTNFIYDFYLDKLRKSSASSTARALDSSA